MLDVLELSLASAAGQIFIFYTIFEFGSLMCSIITTFRKFCSILYSVLSFGHILSTLEWTSVVVVFVGLFLERINDNHEEEKKKKEEKNKREEKEKKGGREKK